MSISLVVTSGSQRGAVIPIVRQQFLIGRNPTCQLRPLSTLVSDFHCLILRRDGKIFLRDLSTTGTLVNTRALLGELELGHDDNLQVGPLCFQVRMEAPAPAAPTADAQALIDTVVESVTPRPADIAAPAVVDDPDVPIPIEDMIAAAPQGDALTVPDAPEASPQEVDDAVAALLLEPREEGALPVDAQPPVAVESLPAAAPNAAAVAKEILQEYRLRRRPLPAHS